MWEHFLVSHLNSHPIPLHTENIMPRNISHIGKKLKLTEGYHLLMTDKYNIIKMTSQVNMHHAPIMENRWFIGLEEKHRIHNIYALFHINVQDAWGKAGVSCVQGQAREQRSEENGRQ